MSVPENVPVTHPSRSLLIKPVSGDCNLNCTYCFYHDRSTDPYGAGRHHQMSPEVLDRLIQQGMRLNRQYAAFGWQGGEPTLAGLDFFQKVVKLEQAYGFPGQTVSNALQTNGLLLDPAWARFLREYHFLVGVSLDGPALYHDHYRTYVSGAPTQEKVLETLHLLRDHRVDFNVLAVVNHLTAAHGAEIFDYFFSLGIQFMQFIPCVEIDRATGRLADCSVEPEQFGDFLCAIFDRWYNGGNPRASVRDFDAILAVYLGQEAPLCCYQRECGSYLVVEYSGDVYPCDFMVEEKRCLGSLLRTPLEQIFSCESLQRFAAEKATLRPECQVCSWIPYCHQGCPRFLHARGERHYLCRAYQRFFAHSRAGFLSLRDRMLGEKHSSSIRGSRAPKRSIGRNDPCPCGSGRKFKVCCR